MPISYHQRIVNFLMDGQWHSLQEIHTQVARFIDATVADREYQRGHPNWEQDKRPIRIAAGKRRLILLSMLTLVHNRKLAEIGKGRAMDRHYRLTKQTLRKRAAVKKATPEPQA